MNQHWHTWAQAIGIGLLVPCLAACSLSHTVDTSVDADRSDGGREMFDSALPDSTLPDANLPDTNLPDTNLPPSCSPIDAVPMQCPEVVCDGPPTFAWDGERCNAIECGTCVGTECGQTTSREECERAHRSCDAPLCRETGGEWRFWAEDCMHYVCGRPTPVLCAVGQAVCDCGVQARFEPGLGCVPDPTCGEPVPPDEQELCADSGGQWTTVCSHTRCGESFDPCTNLACRCGDRQIFDLHRGCIEASVCYERQDQQVCDDPRDRCPTGEICCPQFTGAGSRDPICRRPSCGHGPDEDICGNCLTCP